MRERERAKSMLIFDLHPDLEVRGDTSLCQVNYCETEFNRFELGSANPFYALMTVTLSAYPKFDLH